jgi:hypothetical protein
MSKNTRSMVFVELWLILAFFSCGDDGLFHCNNCRFVSGSYTYTQDSSQVMILDVKDGLSVAHGELGTLRRDVPSAQGSAVGRNLAATHHMLNSEVTIVQHSNIVGASSRIRSIFSWVMLVEGLPDRSSSRNVLPPLKRLFH